MKFQLLSFVALTATTTSAFQVRPQQPLSQTSLGMSSYHTNSDPNALGENRGNEQILSALGTLEGPSMNYGHFGRLEGKTELEIKGYDNFDRFRDAINQVGVNKLLQGVGPFTVFAPTNSAIEAYQGVLSEEVLMTHIVAKDIFSDEMEKFLEEPVPSSYKYENGKKNKDYQLPKMITVTAEVEDDEDDELKIVVPPVRFFL